MENSPERQAIQLKKEIQIASSKIGKFFIQKNKREININEIDDLVKQLPCNLFPFNFRVFLSEKSS